MCTAINYLTRNHYFGRNLDYEKSYGEKITITPRNFSLEFRHMDNLEHHLAIIGMAAVFDNYPLYYDGTNEAGLSMAGLNFPGNAAYHEYKEGMMNIAPFELIPWVLGQCSSVDQVKNVCEHINVLDEDYNPNMKNTPLHWIISDRNKSIVAESTIDGLKIYDNPTGVLTNNPPFDMQLFNINNYRHLSSKTGENNFSENLELEIYSRGMGALGLPGDLSSASRFIRATFVKENSLSGESEEESVSQFFHILGSVEQQMGCVEVEKGQFEYTIYSSCINTDRGIYYYKTYNNSRITAIDLYKENLDADQLVTFELQRKQDINWGN
jgi:choloylglycine hydrolase